MNILKLNKISPLINNVFDSKYKLLDSCENPDGIILRSFKMHDYAMPSSLLCIGRAGAGVNNIPIDKCSENGIVVFNTPGANANAVKELVLCAMFMCARKINQGINWVQSLNGQTDVAKKVEEGKGSFGGTEITGKTLGVIGLGAIGILVANSAIALGMNVVGYDPNISEEKAKALNPNIKVVDSLDKLYPLCEYISIHVPLLDATRNMINSATIDKCKKGVNIINCARGELVNNNDIKTALKEGKVNCYATDFPNEEVLNVENIITIPHLGASSEEAEENCAEMASNQMKNFLENGDILNSVNFPALSLNRCDCKTSCNDKKRITIAYKGDLDIDSIIEKAGIKSCNKANAKRGAYGYAIIDTENADKANSLNSVEGILKVRII